MRIRTAVLVAAAMVVPLVAACGDDEDGATGAEQPLAGLLAHVPTSEAEDGSVLLLGDLAGSHAMRGLAQLSDLDDVEALIEHRVALFGGGETDTLTLAPWLTRDSWSHPTAVRDELGFSLEAVDRFVEGAPLLGMSEQSGDWTVLEGDRIDPDAISAAIGQPEQRDGVMVWLVGAGDGNAMNPDDSTRVRPLGRALRIAHDGQRLLVARTQASLDRLLAVATGEEPSAADHDDLAAVASALDERGVLGAYLAPGAVPFVIPPDIPEGEVQELQAQQARALPPYLAWAMGATAGAEADRLATVVVLAYPDAETAAEGAAALETVLAEGSDHAGAWAAQIRSSEVSTDGRLVVARIDFLERGQHPDLNTTRLIAAA